MADFLEERLYGAIQYGSSWTDDYMVNITTTSGGQEYRSLIHPFPIRKFDVTFMMDNTTMWSNLVNTYHRAHGKYSGFRAKCLDEYTSNDDGLTAPTAFNQSMGVITAGSIYQLRKYYGKDKTAGSSGYAYRNIYKPVVGTTLVGIQNTVIKVEDWSVNTTNGQVTFTANKNITITGVSKATSAVISTSNTQSLVTGQSLYITGCVGMTQINGKRALIESVVNNVSITVAINSSAYSTWSSGGIASTNPQTGESVTAGFEFDFPVRFNSALPIGQNKPIYRDINNIELIELLNP